jgi:predicted nucleic acid-binding protein
MPPSTTSLFPDINVWVALTYEGHVHHTTAATWFTGLPPDVTLTFCRFTQLGLLRLLTTAALMGDEVQRSCCGQMTLHPARSLHVHALRDAAA